MIQIFIKIKTVKQSDWDMVYKRILKIANQFPLKLERIKSNRFSKDIDTIHDDLIENRNQEDECVSFWGDQMSYSAGPAVRFYKSWLIHQKTQLNCLEKDVTKPIMWYPVKPCDSGSPPVANGAITYLSSKALHQYAMLAIGIMLENTLPGRAFLIPAEINYNEVEHTRKWLDYIFGESFDVPIYFDRKKLLDHLVNHYDNKADLVGRLDTLYTMQFKNNIDFALKNIGYKPTLEYYAHLLSHTGFGTSGFSDVLLSWIATSKDLEKTLELIATSRKILLSDQNNKYNIKEAEKYNYVRVLKDLLDQYILWPPEQRELLEKFHTNRKALETGREDDFFAAIRRFMGYRIDICPIYTSSAYLFESFMYHDPQQGEKFRNIIDDWIKRNENKYEEAVEKLYEIENTLEKEEIDKEHEKICRQEMETLNQEKRIEKFAERYATAERFFVIEALRRNPYHMDKDTVIEQLQKDIFDLCKQNISDIQLLHKEDKEEKVLMLNRWIKKKRLSVAPEFTKWLEEVDDSVLTSLCILVTFKLYEKREGYARLQMLLNKKYWRVWRIGMKYAIDKL